VIKIGKMKLSIKGIMFNQGHFAKDVNQRFKNKQILMNGEPTENVELDINCNEFGIPEVDDAGNFIFKQIQGNNIMRLRMEMLGLPFVMENDFPNHRMIKLSKKNIIIVELKE
jgi:hypothetical protein